MRSLIKAAVVVAAAALQAACSGGPSPLPSLSTGSVEPQAGAAAATSPGVAGSAGPVAAAPAPQFTPTQRTFQVASTSARAVKCGFNFDAERLKQQFLAAEAIYGGTAADMEKTQKLYDISFSGISRGIASNEEYCSEAKTKVIKEDLNRHLAGDYNPRGNPQVATAKKKQSGGFFSSLFDGEYDVDSGPKIGTEEWWEKQREKTGR